MAQDNSLNTPPPTPIFTSSVGALSSLPPSFAGSGGAFLFSDLSCVLVSLLTFFQFFPLFGFIYNFTFVCFGMYFVLQLMGFEKFNGRASLLFIYFAFICWLFYGTLSLSWAPYSEVGISNLLIRYRQFCTFYVITQFLVNEKRILLFEKLVIFCVLWNVCVAFWEIATFQHLPTSRQYQRLTFMPTSAAFNENDLAAMFLICCPILFFNTGKYIKHFCAVLLTAVFIIFIVQGARLCLIAFTPFYLYYFFFKTNWIYKLLTVSVIVISVLVILSQFPLVRPYAEQYLERHIIRSFQSETESQYASSGSIRLRFYQYAIENVVRTYGLGTGIGSYENTITPDRGKTTNQIPNAHSFFFETLGQEGIVGIGLLCLIVFYPLKSLDKKVAQGVLFFMMAVSVPSSIRAYQFFWNIMAYLYAIFLVTKTTLPHKITDEVS